MDGRRFDSLTRSLATNQSRRRVIGVAIGVLVSGVTGNQSLAAGREPGTICRKDSECASGLCGPKDATGRQRCQCVAPTDCPASRIQCFGATCTAGVCGTAPVSGAACDDKNACTTGDVCDSQGNCAGQPVVCTALDQCHVAGVCDPKKGACSNPSQPNGFACDDGNACTQNDVCISGACRPGTLKPCPVCQSCSGGECPPVASDASCAGICQGGACVPACLPVQSVCDATAPNCCQDDLTECSYEANCTTEQGQAKCCRPIGVACNHRCDCCANADCVGGVCALGAGQQCGSSAECANGSCCDQVCRDVMSDTANCGACGRVCPAPPVGGLSRCVNGNCTIERTGGRTLCNGVCVRTDSSEANCGACGNACASGQTCCSGQCVDRNTDESHCGVCGGVCEPNEYCCGGRCVDVLTDEENCGGCLNPCAGDERCTNGTCQAIAAECKTAGNTCDADGECCNKRCAGICVCTAPLIFPSVNIVPPCTRDEHCCSGKCLLTPADIGGCTLLPLGAPCDHPWHCLSGNCNQVPGVGRVCAPFD